MRLIFNNFMYFVFLKSVFMLLKIFTLFVLFEVMLLLLIFHKFVIAFLHSTWLLMFMIVLLVPISDEHRDLLHIPKLTMFRIV